MFYLCINLKRMTENLQIRQLPFWDAKAEFTITGNEFLALQNFFNLFQDPIQVINRVFTDSLNNGTIKLKYVDQNNKEYSQNEVTSYINQLKEKHAQEQVTEPVL